MKEGIIKRDRVLLSIGGTINANHDLLMGPKIETDRQRFKMRETITSNKGLHMTASEKHGKIILIVLMSLTFWFFPNLAMPDVHEKGHSDSRQYEIRKGDDDKREWKKDDKGHEFTGQLALWFLVAANLNVALSIIFKSANRFLPLGLKTKSLINGYNQLHKKYLMRFHYVLNPIGFCIAFIHFLLSSCRSSPFPEFGLLLMTLIVGLGLMLKFKVTPKSVRRFVYRLHTSSATFSALILVLAIGHLIVD
jgi:hypothetical protein